MNSKPKTFYERDEWKRPRFRVLNNCGYKCMACGATPCEAGKIHVDHIKPIYTYPELALTESNLQVLCEPCNMGKSNLYEGDLRPKIVPKITRVEQDNSHLSPEEREKIDTFLGEIRLVLKKSAQ